MVIYLTGFGFIRFEDIKSLIFLFSEKYRLFLIVFILVIFLWRNPMGKPIGVVRERECIYVR